MIPREQSGDPEGGLGTDREVGGVKDDPNRPVAPRGLLAAQGHHRAACFPQDGLGDTPRQQPPQAFSPVGPHHDQVAPDLIGGAEDLLGGVPFLCPVLHIEFLVGGVEFAQTLLQRFVLGWVPLNADVMDGLLAEVDRRLRDEYFGSMTLGKGAGRPEGVAQLSEKSAATRMVRNGIMIWLLSGRDRFVVKHSVEFRSIFGLSRGPPSGVRSSRA